MTDSATASTLVQQTVAASHRREARTRWLIAAAKDAISTGDMTQAQALQFIEERRP